MRSRPVFYYAYTKGMLRWIMFCWVILWFVSLFSGCAALEDMSTEEVVEVVATEVAEAAPIVASNPTFPGVLTAVISVIAGLAGAGMGAAGQKVAIKKKVADGALGKRASENVESL